MKPPIHGLMAEFKTAEEVLQATRRARTEGYRNLDAYTPYPVEGLATELGLTRTRVPLVVLLGGLVGAGGGFFLQYWAAAVDYPLNERGRPYYSWPAFIPITFELLVLLAALPALPAMFYLIGLPQPSHSLLRVPRLGDPCTDGFG